MEKINATGNLWQVLAKPEGNFFVKKKSRNRDRSWPTVSTIPLNILSDGSRKIISRPGNVPVTFCKIWIIWQNSNSQVIGENALVQSGYRILWSSISLEENNQYLRIFSWRKSPRKSSMLNYHFWFDMARHDQPCPNLPRLASGWSGANNQIRNSKNFLLNT